jgi:hypothetical protein
VVNGFTRRHRSRVVAVALACIVAALATAAVALARTNSLKLTLSPSSGGFGTVYKIVAKGKVAKRNESLALGMTTVPSKKCPSDYASGFGEMSGIANASGKPIAPLKVRKGKLSKTIKSKMTISEPGTYEICGYLTIGAKTKAHAAAVFTVTG